MRVLHRGRIPVKIWAGEVEDGAMQQAVNLSNLPFAYSHIALMPDVHEGFGMPIGGILAAGGVIIPNAVGVDIGCGVTAVKTDIKNITVKQVEQVLKNAKKIIPMGAKHHKKPQEWKGFDAAPKSKIIKEELDSARCQLGTLGGGNHFYSMEEGSDGFVWLLVHSGSRNLGYKVANYYNKVAKEYGKTQYSEAVKHDLAGFDVDSLEGKEYFQAMEFCLHFARANRELISDAFYGVFSQVTGSKKVKQKIDIHHNYAAQEVHFNKELVIHRKGATSAGEGELGVIPGSMGTSSYIVEGLGNPESFTSCSHGAGRTMSRKQANKTISKEEANQSMRGIVFSGWRGDLSEAPQAYKDIEEVMSNQADLVKPLVKLTPLGVMKG